MLFLPVFIHLAAAVNFIVQLPLVDSFPFYNKEERATGSLASFIASEGPVALQGVLNNIGSGGSFAPGVEAGLVVASPSKANPDCQWVSSVDQQTSYPFPVSKSLLHMR